MIVNHDIHGLCEHSSTIKHTRLTLMSVWSRHDTIDKHVGMCLSCLRILVFSACGETCCIALRLMTWGSQCSACSYVNSAGLRCCRKSSVVSRSLWHFVPLGDTDHQRHWMDRISSFAHQMSAAPSGIPRRTKLIIVAWTDLSFPVRWRAGQKIPNGPCAPVTLELIGDHTVTNHGLTATARTATTSSFARLPVGQQNSFESPPEFQREVDQTTEVPYERINKTVGVPPPPSQPRRHHYHRRTRQHRQHRRSHALRHSKCRSSRRVALHEHVESLVGARATAMSI